MKTWSRHSVLTDLTQRSAMALARGDLNGVRTWAIPIFPPDDGMWHRNSCRGHEQEIVAPCDPKRSIRPFAEPPMRRWDSALRERGQPAGWRDRSRRTRRAF